MLASLTFATATTAATAQTYLVSIRGISLTPDESIPSFTVKTWGIEIKAICRIPADWEITGGRFGPLRRIAGELAMDHRSCGPTTFASCAGWL